MAKIKFLVTGIDNMVLGNLIGTLSIGELEGQAEVLVLAEPTPKTYTIGPNGGAKEISFSEFLTSAIGVERKKIIERSTGEKLIREVVEKSSVPAVIPFKPQILQ
jgi:hypothetical protein